MVSPRAIAASNSAWVRINMGADIRPPWSGSRLQFRLQFGYGMAGYSGPATGCGTHGKRRDFGRLRGCRADIVDERSAVQIRPPRLSRTTTYATGVRRDVVPVAVEASPSESPTLGFRPPAPLAPG